MRKKVVIVLCVLLVFALVFLCRNLLLKTVIVHAVSSKFGLATTVETVTLQRRGVTFEGVTIKNDSATLRVEQATLTLDYPRFLKPRLLQIAVVGSRIQIAHWTGFKQTVVGIVEKVSHKKTSPEKQTADRGIALNLANVAVSISEPTKTQVKGVLSLKGNFSQGKVSPLEAITIAHGEITGEKVSMKFSLEPIKDNLYRLSVPSCKIKDEEIKDVSVLLQLVPAKDQARVVEIRSALLGAAVRADGIFDFSDYRNLCLQLGFADISFEEAMGLVSSKEDVVFGGLFNGELMLCLDTMKLSNIGGEFHNTIGGTINIKKEASLRFLKRYLDARSYAVLIDNLKNYIYNEGEVFITREKDAVSLQMLFDSKELGKRSLSVNFHNVLGGEQ